MNDSVKTRAKAPTEASGTPVLRRSAGSLQSARAVSQQSNGSSLLLQRKCACGSNASGLTGKCEECGEKSMLGLQTKLAVSEPGDRYEQEADRIADEVMRVPIPALHREVANQEADDRETLQPKPLSVRITSLIQRRSMAEEQDEEEEMLSKGSGTQASVVTPGIDPQLEEQRKALAERIGEVKNRKISKISDNDIRARIKGIDPDLLKLIPEKGSIDGSRTVEKLAGGSLIVTISSHPSVSKTTLADEKVEGKTFKIVSVLHKNPLMGGNVSFDKNKIAATLLPENSQRSQKSISDEEITRTIRSHFVDEVARPLVHELVHAQIIVSEERQGRKQGAAPQTVSDFKTVESLALGSKKLSKSRESVFKVLGKISPDQDKREALKWFVQEKFVSQRVNRDVFGEAATNEMIVKAFAGEWVKRHVPENLSKIATSMLQKPLVRFFSDLDVELTPELTPVAPVSFGVAGLQLGIERPSPLQTDKPRIGFGPYALPDFKIAGETETKEEEPKKKEEGEVMRKAADNCQAASALPIVHDALQSPAHPLDPSARSFMESRFGFDFSHVRVHTDAKAGESVRSVNALAYTVGRDVVFGSGQYSPNTIEGRKLLAHELTHVVQQSGEESGKKRMLGLQTKLTNSEPGDRYEIEADRVADEVMRTLPPVHQNVESQRGIGQEALQAKPLSAQITPVIQREAIKKEQADQKEEMLQVHERGMPTTVVNSGLKDNCYDAYQRSGHLIEPATRSLMESRFGHDFSQVRVHDDSRAANSARSINAQAFTVGRDVFFGSGQYSPRSHNGRWLLAHELVHTLQQSDRLAVGSAFRLVQAKRNRGEIALNKSCQANHEYAEELRKADRSQAILKRWLVKVGEKELRFDLLRRFRSRHARRICLAAGCGHPDFNRSELPEGTLAKLACFDEAYDSGKLKGVCAELLGAHCPTGPAPPAPYKRGRLVDKTLKESGHNQPEETGSGATLEYELIQVRERLRFAIADLRILQKDRDEAKGSGSKVQRRSRPAEEFFEDAFGAYNATKATDVQTILEQALKLIEEGKVKVVALSPEPSVGADTSGCPRKPDELADEVRHCHSPCTQAEALCSEPWWTCISNCSPKGTEKTEESTVDSEALTEPGQTEPAAPEPQAKTDTTPIWWASQNEDPDCSAAGGYYSPTPEPGKIGLCVKDAERGRISGELERKRLRATLLHELFHKVLGEADVDVYTSSQLFPLLKDLQKPIQTPAKQGEVQPKDPTLALRNPDSLVRFVMQAARVDVTEARRALPIAEETPGAGTCDVDRAQYALGMAHQWLRWGEVTLATAKTNGVATDAQVRDHKTIVKLMRVLGEVGEDRQPLGVNKTVLNPQSVPPSFVQPATLNVQVQGSSVVLQPKGSKVELTVPKAFFAQEQKRKTQIKQVLSALGAPNALIRFLEGNQNSVEDAAVLLSAREPSSCLAGSRHSD